MDMNPAISSKSMYLRTMDWSPASDPTSSCEGCISFCMPVLLIPFEYNFPFFSYECRCKPWLGKNCPELFPDIFPQELAAKLERLKLTGQNDETPGEDDEASSSKNSKKVAKPIVIKNSSGKKRKIAAEVVIALGQRKGRKMVTVVTGLETFGIKLAYAAKICKKKFATGSTVTKAADNREVLEIQGSWQREFADMCHEQYGIPKNTIFVILPGKKKEKVRAFAS